MIKVEDMMTRNPHTLLRTHTLRDAKSMMDALDIRHIPVVDANHHLQGLVTQRDILAKSRSKRERHLHAKAQSGLLAYRA